MPVKHLGNWNEIAAAIGKKLNDQYGGHWCAIIANCNWRASESGYYVSSLNDSYIFLAYENRFFTICQNSDQKLSFPKNENYLALLGAKNENEGIEREALKAAQKKLGINIIISKFNTYSDSEWPMNVKLESFVTDTIVVQRLKNSGNFNEIARAIYEKLINQYGGSWSVLVVKSPISPESGSCFSKVPGSQIDLTYDDHNYTVFNT